MAFNKLPEGQATTGVARRRWHEARLLRWGVRMARMGYWETQSADPTEIWISPEFAVLYEFETDDGVIPLATVRERFVPESRKVLDEHYAACWAWGQPYAVQARLCRSDGTLFD